MFAFSGNMNVTLVGNQETCPRCRHLAPVQDGTIHIVNGMLANVRTEDDARRALSILHDASLGKTTQSDAAKRAQGMSDAAREWTLQIIGLGIDVMVFAMNAIMLWLAFQQANDSSLQEVARAQQTQQIVEALEGVRRSNEATLEEVRRLRHTLEEQEAQSERPPRPKPNPPSAQVESDNVHAPREHLTKRQRRRLEGRAKAERRKLAFDKPTRRK